MLVRPLYGSGRLFSDMLLSPPPASPLPFPSPPQPPGVSRLAPRLAEAEARHARLQSSYAALKQQIQQLVEEQEVVLQLLTAKLYRWHSALSS